MFREFGLKSALGRLLTEADDRNPGADPYAVPPPVTRMQSW